MEYPVLFEEHIRDVIGRYKTQREKIKNAASFLFLTDVHIHLNGRYSVPLMMEIGKHTDVKTVLCGGDFCWAWGSKAECIMQLEDAFNYMDPLKETMSLYIARGNHDATVRNSLGDPRGYTMPFDQLYPYFAKHNSPASGKVEGRLYFYADDPASKVRYVIVDNTEHHGAEDKGWGVEVEMTDIQLRWLADEALQLPGDDWAVVVMGHISCVPQIPSYNEGLNALAQILTAFSNKSTCRYGDFSNRPGTLVMYLCGHNHKDSTAIVDNVLHISTGCDSYCKDDVYPRDIGSINNVLFDLFLVDKDRRTVQVFRVGAGESREMNY